jgi:hypothetical protein
LLARIVFILNFGDGSRDCRVCSLSLVFRVSFWLQAFLLQREWVSEGWRRERGWQFFKHSKSSEITVAKKIACDSRLNWPSCGCWSLLAGRVWAGHNILSFDIPRIQEAFAEAGLQAPTAAGVIDTLRLLKSTFGCRAGNMKVTSCRWLKPPTCRFFSQKECCLLPSKDLHWIADLQMVGLARCTWLVILRGFALNCGFADGKPCFLLWAWRASTQVWHKILWS